MGMNFYDLIEFAKREQCSDVHITVGTSLAIRQFGKLKMLEEIPTAEESTSMILECLTEQERSRVLAGEDLDMAQHATDVPTFEKAPHSALREDPDLILVGEMRDYETICAAITAAETGHLVLSTLHTSSAAQSIERIIDAYPSHGQAQARTQLANVLKGIVTQVLVPEEDIHGGMTIATEVLLNTDAIANQIRENKTHQITSSIISSGSTGMHTMNADLKRLEREGRISRATALKYCSNVKDYDNQR